MVIGILKEQPPETRVALIPDAIREILQHKVQVFIEQGAGTGAFYRDEDYKAAGATPASRKEVLEHADCMVTLSSLKPEDVRGWEKGKIVAGGLDPYNSKPLVDELLKRNMTSFSLELLPRTSLAQSMDILSSMATVSGYLAILDAAMHYAAFFPCS